MNKDVEKNLKIMEAVEDELNKQKYDAIFCLTAFTTGTSAWILFVSLCDKLNWPLSQVTMTKGVEIVASLMLILVLKFTRLDFKDLGISTKNLKSSLKRAIIISLVCVMIMIAYKLIVYKGEPLFNGIWEKPTYLITSIVQEFLARGFLLSSLLSIYTSKKGKIMAIVCSSFLFSSLHLFYGFNFMCCAGGLSILLGYVYTKDQNIWGVSLIHFILGYVSFLLGLA